MNRYAYLLIKLPPKVKLDEVEVKYEINSPNWSEDGVDTLRPFPEELDENEALRDHDEFIFRVGYNDALRNIKGEGWTCKIGGFFDR